MLDFNPRPSMAERINALIDAALIAEREATPPRTYLGASRLGHACERALQFEFACASRSEPGKETVWETVSPANGADFSGQAGQVAHMIHALCRADTGQLFMFPQEGRQAQGLEMMREQKFGSVGHASLPASRLI